ncbi:insulin-like growth factor-binding protein complex acid labile subunit [Anopheles bellator]|uniref:insulin-like growth factor-binding protein complex acid labile subunit n=1 Tax=Anopheles bellator TaxID=139047 RepID=UPI002649C5A8|nr:insulin-like growth factor-binding protein complex acid labile subunit [Anopheles bellator]
MLLKAALLHPYNELLYLDLSHNQIAKLDAFKLQALVSWPRLTHLNLSFNHIKTVTNQLGKLEQLVWLDLSNNKIHRDAKAIVLPGNIQELRMDSNQLTDWPFDGIPYSLKNLSLRFNELHSVKAASGVQRLDLSYNNLSDMEGDCFPSLEELDLSSNFFNTLPLLSNTTEPWPLRKLTFSRMPNLQTIDRNFLSKATNLMDLKITICPKVTHLEENLFTGLSALERLDLSYNGLQQIPEQLADWGKIKHGVNLQGNPINCNCSMQWMLDRLIPEMKRHRELHHLFTRLRCVRPTIFHDQLLVHLTAYNNVLCRSTRELIGMEHVITMADESEKWIVIQKIILAVLVVCIVIVACYLIYLKRKPRYTVVPKIIWTYKAGM